MGEGSGIVRRISGMVYSCLRWIVYWATLALFGGTVVYAVVMELYGYPTRQLLANAPIVNLVGPETAAFLLILGVTVLVSDLVPESTGGSGTPKVESTPATEAVTTDEGQTGESTTTRHCPVAGDPGVYRPAGSVTIQSPDTDRETPDDRATDSTADHATQTDDSGPRERKAQSTGHTEETSTAIETETAQTEQNGMFGIFV